MLLFLCYARTCVWFVFIFYIDSYDELLKLMITRLEMKGQHKRTKIEEGYL